MAQRLNINPDWFKNLLIALPLISSIISKSCTDCGQTKLLRDYHKNSKSPDGFRPNCKECVLGFQKEWRVDHKPEKAARAKIYREANAPKIAAKKKNDYGKDKARIMQVNLKNYYRRKKEDPPFKLLCNLRTRILHLLKGVVKSARSLELVGVNTSEDYMDHIVSTFWPGMTIANDGPMKWQVDHITPLSSFDKSISGWQFKAFHWSNTQALWKDDNQFKNGRTDWSPLESKHELPERFKRLAKPYWNVIGVR